MRKYLTEYLKALEAKLADPDAQLDYDELEQSHLIMIGFMQHERLIHFLVTILFALGFFITLAVYLLGEQIMLLPLLLLILGLLVPYIAHYYFLENSVQKMYKLHDEIHARRLRKSESSSAS